MAFFIDLNETSITSPREAEVGPSGGILVYAVCKKGVPGGRRNGPASEEWKCFRCLLKSGGSGGGGSGSSVGLLDINASPPREVEAEVERNFVHLTDRVAATARQNRERNHGGTSKSFDDGFPNLFINNAQDIRGHHVAFLASFSSPAVIFEQLSVIYALPRLFTASFTLVLPFFPTGSFERMEEEGDVATAFTLARMLSSVPISRGGPTNLVVYDIHALQV